MMNEHWKPVATVSMIVLLVVASPFAVTSAETASNASISIGDEATASPDGTMTKAPGETVTLTVWANATNVSGYQSRITFDSAVVEVTDVSGTSDFDSPVANVDNENGSVTFNQIRPDESTDPLLAEITVEVVGTDGQQSDLSFDISETKFSDDAGETFAPDSLRSVTVNVESTTPSETETETKTPSETETPSATPTPTATPTATPTPDTGSDSGGSDNGNSNAGGGGGGGAASPSPSFHVSSVELNTTAATVGEEVTVQADVRNSGGDGTYTVQFTVNETPIETARVDIESGESRTVTFTRRLSNPGTFEFGLNGRAVGTTNVTAATPTPTNQVTETETATATALSTPARATTEPAPATDKPTDRSSGTPTAISGAVSRSGPGFGAPAVLSALAVLVGGLLLHKGRK